MIVQIVCWLLLFAWQLAPGTVSAAQRETTRSPHGPLAIPCENCHTAAGWRPIRAVPEFDHNKTKYPLRGMHEKVNCTQCHVKPIFTDVGKNCQDCHADIHQRQMGTDCAQCHTVQGWNIAVQQVKDHQNRFPLLGAHAAVQCDECHKGAAVGQFQGLSTACVSCHLQDFQRTTNPNHVSAQFPTTCDACHSFDSWLGAKNFNHSAPPINFPLTNGHANVPCASCHINNNYNLTIALTDCGNSGCHLTTWRQTNNPVHSSAGPAFAVGNCSGCHNTVSWTTAIFDHSATGFLLTNGHANVPCASCHTNNNYNLTVAPTDCGNSGCHLTKWQQTNNPVHPSAGPAFAVGNCSGCHNTTSWTTAIFDHSTTGFLLTNGHANVPCASCHTNNNYNLTIAPTDCGNSGCHLTRWQQTTTPVHSTSGPAFAATNCANCHTTSGWTAAAFDHSVTGFTLTGTHASPTPTPCASCHISNNYTLNSMDCMGCHQPDWNKTPTYGGSVPDHIKAGFPSSASACATCHPITKWADGKFDHNAFGFPLTNAHALVANGGKVPACASCHINNNYNLTIAPTDCGNSGCHLTTWQQTNNPVHPSAGASFAAANCSTCHNTITWTTATFDHSVTGFPLTNSHQLAPAGKVMACTGCHINNNYNLTIAPTDCGNSGCHLTTWQQTNNPVHPSAGAPFAAANCSTCHNTITWTTAIFNHASTGWPLTGSHQLAPAGKVVACTDCHTGNNYTFTAANTDCYGCHTTAWQSTTTMGGAVPNHIAAGFPTSLCSTCHDTVLWADGKFDHSTTGWPLQGTHVTTPCASCHIGNKYNLTVTDCYTSGCHVAAWLSTQTLGGQVPNHIAAGFPTTCVACHTTWVTTGWLGATLSPAQHTWFRIPHQGSSVCSDCHLVSANYATFSCENCHSSPNAHRPGMSHPNVCSPSPACWYNPPTRCYDCHKQ